MSALRDLGRWWARRPALLAAALAILALLASDAAWARVGGGESFSGGGSSSGGGGGSSDDSDLIFFLLWLCIEHPAIGVPVTLIVIVIAIVKKSSASAKKEWTTGAPSASAYVPPAQRGQRRQLERLRAQDPAFSSVLFEDFLYALYAAAHEARGRGALDELSPYLSPAARGRFHKALPGAPRVIAVEGVIVGSMQVLRVSGVEGAADAVRVSVRFESNLTEAVAADAGQTRERRLYVAESWHLVRKKGAVSRPPDRARKIGCPSCGAALSAVRGNTCSYCQKVVDTGAFDWLVESVDVARRDEQPPAAGGGGGVESGTNLPTLIAPDAPDRLRELGQRDPEFTLDAFKGRAEMIFRELQAAWSERDWLRVRPYVSDNLFQMQLYWIEGFKALKVRNVLDEVKVQRLELASLVSDAHYDAVTVRIFASCLDYVVREDGSLVRGNKQRPTAFSEYWTFIRGRGRSGRPSVEKRCPNCGAPQKIGQAGTCEFCQAKITSGEFDWILSRIEQDDVYAG